MGVKESQEVAAVAFGRIQFRTDPTALTSYLSPAYHELAGLSSEPLDVLSQLKVNLSQIEDLHSRLNFMVAEVSELIKKS